MTAAATIAATLLLLPPSRVARTPGVAVGVWLAAAPAWLLLL
jgi:hypothetical protein